MRFLIYIGFISTNNQLKLATKGDIENLEKKIRTVYITQDIQGKVRNIHPTNRILIFPHSFNGIFQDLLRLLNIITTILRIL